MSTGGVERGDSKEGDSKRDGMKDRSGKQQVS